MSQTPIPLPTAFLLSTPLYAKSSFDGFQETNAVLNILYQGGTYDNYCTKCKQGSTFQIVEAECPYDLQLYRQVVSNRLNAGMKTELPPVQFGVHTVHAFCTRKKEHTQDFLFFIDERILHEEERQAHQAATIRTIEKIGQQPSFGDIHLAKIKKYTHVLTKPQLGELSRAIGLASHDVGVGSYTYLRRVFESLVEEAHQIAKKEDPEWKEEVYCLAKMKERIGILKGHLPAFLAENPSMYSLLSKGIHELSEEECLKHFDTLRIAIELILDERIEQREKKQKTTAAIAALQKATGSAGA